MGPDSQTYGALLVGGLIALYLSGIVSTQVFLYRRTYPDDRCRNKAMVGVVWILDLFHSGFVCASVFHYLIGGFSDRDAIHFISWPVSVTISITGFLTFLIHIFFVHRVWTLSREFRWRTLLTSVIAVLAFLRMLSAFGTVIQMHRFHTWAGFHKGAAWSFTTGLAISASVDFMIALSLCYFLTQSKKGFSSMDQIIDSIMVYTIENGFLTSFLAVASLACWLSMPSNFIFLALHFCISKTYANSFLATLNARTHLQERATNSSVRQNNSIRLPTLLTSNVHRSETVSTDKYSATSSGHYYPPQVGSQMDPTNTLQINVEKTVHCVTDIESVDAEPFEAAYIRGRRSGDAPFQDTIALKKM